MDLYWIWLTTIKGVGPVTAKKLLLHFKTPDNIYNTSKEELYNIEGLSSAVKDNILNSKSLKEAENILDKCNKYKISLLTYNNALYPEDVKKLPKSPILLYYKGTIIENSLGVGIVGSRRCTEYGKQVAKEAAEFLAQNNIPVISGMAKGIDGYAHTACIKAGGYSIAFLGCGVDICYPQEHISLMEKLIANGVVISEYPPGVKPDARYFPERNRLISVWSRKLLVIEASEKSGSLITAGFSKKYNRQVFAVPNSIYNRESVGTNKLIYSGANIYLNPKQLLIDPTGEYKVVEDTSVKGLEHTNLTPMEAEIISKIKEKPMSIDELIVVLKKDKNLILETISMMELEGKIGNISGKFKAI